MRMQSESLIAHPVQAVFDAYRDHMSDVAAFIDDVKEINVLEREDIDGMVKLHNEWVSDKDIPALASKFIKPEHLRWDDYATWYADELHCKWRIKTRVWTDAVDCSGQTSLVADGKGTKVVLIGDLNIAAGELPGVPSFMAKRLGPGVEKFIVNLITPNLEATNVAIGRYLDSRQS